MLPEGINLVTYLNLGVLGLTFVLLLRGDLRLRREVDREEKATVRERELGDVLSAANSSMSAAMDRLTEAVLKSRAPKP